MRGLFLIALISSLLGLTAHAQCGGGGRAFNGLFSGIFRGGGCGAGGDEGQFRSWGSAYGSREECASGEWQMGRTLSYSYEECGNNLSFRTTPSVPGTGKAVVYLRGLPAGATLTINGTNYTKPGVADLRTFVSPNLLPGYNYHYDFVVKYRDTKNNLVTRSLGLNAQVGNVTTLDVNRFHYSVATNEKKSELNAPKLNPAPARAPATLEWDLPRKASIYLDNKLVEAPDKREINRVMTKPLEPGQRYTWDIVVQYENDHQGFAEVKRTVYFTAGDKLVLGISKSKSPELLVSFTPEPMNFVAAVPVRGVER